MSKSDKVITSVCDFEANMPIFHNRVFENHWKTQNPIPYIYLVQAYLGS